MSVALCSQALSLLASLLEDVNFENVTTQDQDNQNDKVEPASFDLFHSFEATQRVALIFKSTPFIQLLFNVSVISYRKACNLRCLVNRELEAIKERMKK